MGTRFSIVYPTRHRPEFIRQALQVLETQQHDDFEVVVSDNYSDPALSAESACRESSVPNVRYVRPPEPLGMVENWNHALPFATGDYVCVLTDKMFVLPDALGRVARAIGLADGPDIVSWTGDAYNPAAYPDYFREGLYVSVSSEFSSGRLFRPFSPTGELERRGKAEVSRTEQTASQYSRGKLVFGAYRHDLVERIVERHGALFHNINPDYTSMILGLSSARAAVEMGSSCVVSVNTDVSNGWLSDTNDAAALAFLSSLAGGAEAILPTLFVPGLYASLHNWVAHDFATLRQRFDLGFTFDIVNWLTYCTEDIHRPGRQWTDPQVESQQKDILSAFISDLDPSLADEVASRVAERAGPRRPPLHRRVLRRLRSNATQPRPRTYPSLVAAVAGQAAGEA